MTMLLYDEALLQVRPLNLEDLDEVASIHCSAFHNSALTKLGHEAVRRYYEWQMIGPHDAVNLGVFGQDILIGFCFGGVSRGALGGFLEKNRAYLVQQVVMRPWLLSNPLFRERAQFAARRIFRRLSSPKIERPLGKIDFISQPLPSFGILSIAVTPKYQGSGAAKLLMEYSEEIAIERGFVLMGLTVHPSNGRAVRFYEKMGWQRDEINGPWTGHMSKAIGSREVGLL